MSKFTKIREDTFENLQMNAGIIASDFDPATGTLNDEDILGATSGGVQFTATPQFLDFGEDIDNCPKNTLELKRIQDIEATMSGTFIAVDITSANILVGAGDVSGNKITPRNTLATTDFTDVWWIGDYTNVNTGASAGFMAIHLMNALNTGGFSIQTSDKGKGQFAFEFTGHYSIEEQDTVPYEIYVQGNGALVPSVLLNKHVVTIAKDDTYTLTASTVPDGETITWTSSDGTKASVSNGVVSGEAVGSAIITAKITVDGVNYTDTCTVVVEATS